MARIGTRFCGEIGLPGGHSIQTKFFVLGAPLIPLESFYVMKESPGFFSSSVQGLPIPLHGRSVLAGYLEVVIGIGLIVCLIAVCAGDGWIQRGLGIVAVIVLFAAVVKLRSEGPRVEMHRAMLHEVLGMSADPHWLPQDTFDRAYANLIRLDEEGAIEKRSFRGVSLAYALWAYGGDSMRRQGNHERSTEWCSKANRILDAVLGAPK